MKKLIRLSKFTAIVGLLTAFTSCSDDDEITPPVEASNTIADFVAANDDYSSLAAALEVTGLDATLAGEGEFTVFAPDNDAFAAFLSDNGFSTLSEVPQSLLTQVLLNHVQAGRLMAVELSTGYLESMATGSASEEKLSLYVNTENGVSINGVAKVTTADVEVDNGIIHAVDAVIGLPTIVTFATADPEFSTLVAALTREEDYPFVEVLMQTADPAPFTVFAPTNAAFTALLEELEVSGLDAFPADVLASVLNYHVVAGANVRSAALMDGMEVTSLAEQAFTIDLSDGAMINDASGRTSNIVVVDVQADNGVIHVLDKVLLPQM